MKISLLYEGSRVRRRYLPEEIANIHTLSVQRDYLFHYCGIDEVEIKAGICGAPIVHEPSRDLNILTESFLAFFPQ